MSGDSEDVLEVEAALGSLEAIRTIGHLEPDAGVSFGLVRDLAVGPTGTLYVLDARFQRIVVLSSDGTELALLGRPGMGPGEYAHPAELVLSGHRMFTLDQRNRRIHVYSVREELPELTETILLPFMARGFCVLGDRIFLTGLFQENVLHEVDWEGRILHSFGELYPAEEIPPGSLRSSLQGTMSSGKVVCAPEADLIVSLPQNRSTITAFRPDGAVVWSAELPGYQQMVAYMTPRGTMAYAGSPETGRQHTLAGALVWKNWLVVQLVVPRPQRTMEELVPETRVIALESGKHLLRVEGLPHLRWMDTGSAVGFSNDPYPELVVLHRP